MATYIDPRKRRPKVVPPPADAAAAGAVGQITMGGKVWQSKRETVPEGGATMQLNEQTKMLAPPTEADRERTLRYWDTIIKGDGKPAPAPALPQRYPQIMQILRPGPGPEDRPIIGQPSRESTELKRRAGVVDSYIKSLPEERRQEAIDRMANNPDLKDVLPHSREFQQSQLAQKVGIAPEGPLTAQKEYAIWKHGFDQRMATEDAAGKERLNLQFIAQLNPLDYLDPETDAEAIRQIERMKRAAAQAPPGTQMGGYLRARIDDLLQRSMKDEISPRKKQEMAEEKENQKARLELVDRGIQETGDDINRLDTQIAALVTKIRSEETRKKADVQDEKNSRALLETWNRELDNLAGQQKNLLEQRDKLRRQYMDTAQQILAPTPGAGEIGQETMNAARGPISTNTSPGAMPGSTAPVAAPAAPEEGKTEEEFVSSIDGPRRRRVDRKAGKVIYDAWIESEQKWVVTAEVPLSWEEKSPSGAEKQKRPEATLRPQGARQPPAGYTQAPDGHWYRPDPARPGKYLRWNP